VLLSLIHYLFAVLAAASVLAFVGLGLALQQFFNPDRSLDDKLTNWLTPNRRPSDFVGPGWRLQKLQWLSFALIPVSLLLWGFTGYLSAPS
jgi:hypothetical protein